MVRWKDGSDEWMGEWMDDRVSGCMNRWMDECLDRREGGWMDESLNWWINGHKCIGEWMVNES